MNKGTLLVIDCNNLAHRARHVIGELAFKGESTGVIFGFLKQLFHITKEIRPTHFVFAWDSRQSFRKQIYKEYKANRITAPEDKEALEDAFRQFELLKKQILPSLGFTNIYEFHGYEADDIVASAVKQARGNFQQIIIVSSDSDLLQCLSPSVSIYTPTSKSFYTQKDFETDKDISVSQWASVKAIAGCSSDNVPGIKGVGEKTAILYLNGLLSDQSKKYKEIVSWKYTEDGNISEEYRRNMRLVRLPFKNIPELKIEKHTFDLQGFKKMCRQYGFKSWETDTDWEAYFE